MNRFILFLGLLISSSFVFTEEPSIPKVRDRPYEGLFIKKDQHTREINSYIINNGAGF